MAADEEGQASNDGIASEGAERVRAMRAEGLDDGAIRRALRGLDHSEQEIASFLAEADSAISGPTDSPATGMPEGGLARIEELRARGLPEKTIRAVLREEGWSEAAIHAVLPRAPTPRTPRPEPPPRDPNLTRLEMEWERYQPSLKVAGLTLPLGLLLCAIGRYYYASVHESGKYVVIQEGHCPHATPLVAGAMFLFVAVGILLGALVKWIPLQVLLRQRMRELDRPPELADSQARPAPPGPTPPSALEADELARRVRRGTLAARAYQVLACAVWAAGAYWVVRWYLTLPMVGISWEDTGFAVLFFSIGAVLLLDLGISGSIACVYSLRSGRPLVYWKPKGMRRPGRGLAFPWTREYVENYDRPDWVRPHGSWGAVFECVGAVLVMPALAILPFWAAWHTMAQHPLVQARGARILPLVDQWIKPRTGSSPPVVLSSQAGRGSLQALRERWVEVTGPVAWLGGHDLALGWAGEVGSVVCAMHGMSGMTGVPRQAHAGDSVTVLGKAGRVRDGVVAVGQPPSTTLHLDDCVVLRHEPGGGPPRLPGAVASAPFGKTPEATTEDGVLGVASADPGEPGSPAQESGELTTDDDAASPTSAEGHEARDLVADARQLKDEGRLDEAEAVLQEALASDPDDPEAHCLMAWVLLSLDRAGESADEFGAVLKLAPDSQMAQEAHSALERLGLAKPLAEEVRLPDQTHVAGPASPAEGVESTGLAATEYRQLPPGSPEPTELTSDVLLTRAEQLSEEHCEPVAAALLEAAATGGYGTPELHYTAAQALIAIGCEDRAAKQLQDACRARRNGPYVERAAADLAAMGAPIPVREDLRFLWWFIPAMVLVFVGFYWLLGRLLPPRLRRTWMWAIGFAPGLVLVLTAGIHLLIEAQGYGFGCNFEAPLGQLARGLHDHVPGIPHAFGVPAGCRVEAVVLPTLDALTTEPDSAQDTVHALEVGDGLALNLNLGVVDSTVGAWSCTGGSALVGVRPVDFSVVDEGNGTGRPLPPTLDVAEASYDSLRLKATLGAEPEDLGKLLPVEVSADVLHYPYASGRELEPATATFSTRFWLLPISPDEAHAGEGYRAYLADQVRLLLYVTLAVGGLPLLVGTVCMVRLFMARSEIRQWRERRKADGPPPGASVACKLCGAGLSPGEYTMVGDLPICRTCHEGLAGEVRATVENKADRGMVLLRDSTGHLRRPNTTDIDRIMMAAAGIQGRAAPPNESPAPPTAIMDRVMDEFEQHLRQVPRVAPSQPDYAESHYSDLVEAMVVAFHGETAFVKRRWSRRVEGVLEKWLSPESCRPFLQASKEFVAAFPSRMVARAQRYLNGPPGDLRRKYVDVMMATVQHDPTVTREASRLWHESAPALTDAPGDVQEGPPSATHNTHGSLSGEVVMFEDTCGGSPPEEYLRALGAIGYPDQLAGPDDMAARITSIMDVMETHRLPMVDQGEMQRLASACSDWGYGPVSSGPKAAVADILAKSIWGTGARRVKPPPFGPFGRESVSRAQRCGLERSCQFITADTAGDSMVYSHVVSRRDADTWWFAGYTVHSARTLSQLPSAKPLAASPGRHGLPREFLESLPLRTPNKGPDTATSVDRYVAECISFRFPTSGRQQGPDDVPGTDEIAAAGNAGLTEETVRLAQAMISGHPHYYFPYLWIGIVHIGEGEYAKAREALIQGLERAERKDSLCSRLGVVGWKLGDLREACKWWIRSAVIQLDTGRLEDNDPFLYLSAVAYALYLAHIGTRLGGCASRISGGTYLEPRTAASLNSLVLQRDFTLARLEDGSYLGRGGSARPWPCGCCAACT